MSKPPPRIISGILRFHFNRIQNPRPSNRPPQLSNSRGFQSSFKNQNVFPVSGSHALKSHIQPAFRGFISRQISQNRFSDPKLNFPSSFSGFSWRKCLSTGSQRLKFDPLGFRRYSVKIPGFGSKIDAGFAKKIMEKPVSAIGSSFSRYREAALLQTEGFLKRNYLLLVGAGGLLVCYVLWRIMFAIADTTVGLSEGMAKYGFLALSTAVVAFAGLYWRSRYTINPDKVYRIAMRKLNTSASILEVMGTPLTGTDLRAYVMSGGGISLSKFKPRLRSKRCFLIFPIHGSERKGLVSVEVKKKKGQYDMKLLAVDIPMASGPDQRLFLIGDEEEYKVGGGLIADLRDPVVKAMAATKEFESLDQIEEDQDEERELQEAEQKQRDEIEKLKGGSES